MSPNPFHLSLDPAHKQHLLRGKVRAAAALISACVDDDAMPSTHADLLQFFCTADAFAVEVGRASAELVWCGLILLGSGTTFQQHLLKTERPLTSLSYDHVGT